MPSLVRPVSLAYGVPNGSTYSDPEVAYLRHDIRRQDRHAACCCHGFADHRP